MPTSPNPAPVRSTILGALLILLLSACGDGPDQGVVDREAFIAAFVDLRVEALMNEEREITDEERAAVLRDHGVSEEDLVSFAEVMGRDVTYMRDLWDEVEERLDAMRPEIDESGTVVRPIDPGR